MPRLLDTTLTIDNLSHFKYGVGNTQESKGDGSRGAYHLYKNVIYENELGPFDLGNADQIREMLSMATPLMETKERAGFIQKGTELFDAITKMKQLQKKSTHLGIRWPSLMILTPSKRRLSSWSKNRPIFMAKFTITCPSFTQRRYLIIGQTGCK